jgi:two-component system, OmpR family, alkaline phosphatase synthesis response regulator PhoP
MIRIFSVLLIKKRIKLSSVILDVKFNGMSGFKVAHKIRNNPKTESVPLVFLTVKSDENDKLTAYSIDADDYINKPFFVRGLIARIKVIISRAEVRKTNLSHLV